MANVLTLDNTNVQKSIRKSIHSYLSLPESLDEINRILAKTYSGQSVTKFTKLTADNVFEGRRPNRNMRNFPAISVVSTGRSSEWIASRTTEETMKLRIFCCVLYTDQSLTEDVMEDFTDAVMSLLYKYTKFSWSFTNTETPANIVSYDAFDCKPNSIEYGMLDSGFLRAGQIDWQGRVLLAQNAAFL